MSAAKYGFFVTGTDTGIGKTLIACALLRAFARRGLRAVGMKPVAAGAERTATGWVNEDVAALRAAGNVDAPTATINPYCFEPPVAPHLAAGEAGVEIDSGEIARCYGALQTQADVVVVEGAGGFLVPLSAAEDMGTLAERLALPIILVVGMRLGCINHALLTAEAIGARGLVLAGWVANHVDPGMARADANVAALSARLATPLLARVPYGADIEMAAKLLDTGTLVRESRPIRV